MRTHGLFIITLVHVPTVHAVGSQGVPERARAAEGAQRVVAAERAGRPAFEALVYVYACLGARTFG